MIPGLNHTKYALRYQTEGQQRVNTNQDTFEKKFKLTQKIHKLSSPMYERSLSPWTRRRNQSIDRKHYAPQQMCVHAEALNQIPIQSMRQNPSTVMNETKPNDFLRKIQFTKRRKGATLSSFSPDKNGKVFQFDRYENSDGNNHTDRNMIEFTPEQIKKLIMYPKRSIKLDENKSNESKLKKSKPKELSSTKIATIQNFYDPYQNTPKTATKQTIPKGFQKFTLKIDDYKHFQNKTTSFSTVSNVPLDLESTFRKGSVDQKSNRQHMNLIEQNSYLQQGYHHKNTTGTQRTFFKTHKKSFSHQFATQPSQKHFQSCQNPQDQHGIQTQPPVIIIVQPSYATPTGQAIKRIKQQYKRSRKIKTEEKQSNHLADLSLSPNKGENNEFLYKTFLNYKTQKHSNDLNITKTLKLTFHNKQTFQKRIEKILNMNGT